MFDGQFEGLWPNEKEHVLDTVLYCFSPAILQYLATQYTHHAGYGGHTLAARMLVESLLSWANAELHRHVYTHSHFV